MRLCRFIDSVSGYPLTRKRLAVLTTHPIQYQAPWFRALANEPDLDFHVFFCHQASAGEQAGAGFGVKFDWDVPLLTGYPYRFLKNVARRPTIATFTGLDTPELFSIIQRARYDAVLINGWHYKSAWQAIYACWRTHTPVMVRSDSNLHASRPALKKIFKELTYRMFIPRFDACLAVGTWSRDYFVHYGAAPRRVFIVPHTIDENLFTAQFEQWRLQRAELRRNWGLGADANVFVFIGKFIGKKRPLDFVKAVALATSSEAQLMGLMVGDGPLREECESLAAQNGAPVRFAGFLNQSQIVRAYAVADALVLPSDSGETWGLVVNEAMTCELPCFVSDRVGCGLDLVITGQTGEIFPFGSVTELADLLVRYASNPSQLERMGQCARVRIRLSSTPAAVAGTFRALEAVAR